MGLRLFLDFVVLLFCTFHMNISIIFLNAARILLTFYWTYKLIALLLFYNVESSQWRIYYFSPFTQVVWMCHVSLSFLWSCVHFLISLKKFIVNSKYLSIPGCFSFYSFWTHSNELFYPHHSILTAVFSDHYLLYCQSQ